MSITKQQFGQAVKRHGSHGFWNDDWCPQRISLFKCQVCIQLAFFWAPPFTTPNRF